MRKINILLLFALFLCRFSICAEEIKIVSPDGNYQMRVYDREGRVYYSVDYKNKPVILESQLGISSNQAGKAIESDAAADNKAVSDWQDGLQIGSVAEKSVDAAWVPPYGERSLYVDLYKGYTIDLQKINNQRKRLQIIVRAYNEGIAFCYHFVGNEYLHITQEFTQFTMPEGTQAYFTPRAQAIYELLPLKNWPGESERPLVCLLPSPFGEGSGVRRVRYVLLTEAGMTNYARSKFTLDKTKPNTIIGSMYGAVDEIAPYTTPWRVIMAAEKAGDLIEHNHLLLNLNPPCEIADPSWIKPGKVMREVTLSTQGGKDLVDFAVKRNLQYIHFDAGWYGPEGSKQSDATTVTLDPDRNRDNHALDLQEVIRYAKSKNIDVILYVNQRALYQQLDTILPLYQSWGVSGIKFGFVQVGSHFWTKWLHEAVKKCAKYNLLVDIHDEYRPTGFSRTYPNLMTQEGIYGNEEFPDATNNVTLPFTRFTQGAADYTICYYRRQWNADTKPDRSHGLVNARLLKTTPAHQLSMAVVYYSPLQYLYWYDKPSDSRDEPELEFFDRVPTVWDNTKVVHGEIGEYITVARRSGEDWFVGTMTGNDARKLKIPLDFLAEGQKYTAKIYYDNPNEKTRTKVGIKTLSVTNKSVIDCDLQASGGQAVWIVPTVGTLHATSLQNKPFAHPGILHTQKDFDRMRKSIADSSYKLLEEHPFSQADYKMQGPFRVISRDGEFRYTKSKMENDFHAAYQNALMWALTKNDKHAQKSLEILSAYADSLEYIPETNDAPLLAGLEGFKIICAMEILRHTYCNVKTLHATSLQMQKIENMFRSVFLPVLENFYRRPPYTNGNWGPIVTKTYMAAGIYFEDREMYGRAKNFYLHGNDNGTITRYIDGATGQIQESGRDQAHAQLGIGAMAVVCELAWKQGDDLYSLLDNRLLKGYEYVAKYNLGYDDVPFRQWTDVTGKYNNWTEISEKARGQLRPIYEIVYNHYVNRKKLKMPFTEKVLEKIRPEGFSGDQPPSFGSLLYNENKEHKVKSKDENNASNFQIDASITYCDRQIRRTLSEIGNTGKIPRNILKNQTKWNLMDVSITDWTVGFWSGILWYDYENTENEYIKQQAVRFTELLQPLTKEPPYDHDLGFQLFCSYGNAYRLTGNEKYKQILLNAADTLATLFNPKVGTFLSWPREVKPQNWAHNTIIDNLINLEMLFWAAKNGGDGKLYDIAVKHAETTMKNHFRADGGCYHVAVYDTADGHFIKGVTHQGYADSSLWARGQAWAIYGYTMVYRETGDKRFLRFAEKVTDLYLSQLTENEYVPYWDFDVPNISDKPRDASVASIVASALLELSQREDNAEKSETYKNYAIKMLEELSSEKYQSREKNPAFLLHSTGHFPAGTEIDASIVYADYYYIEALTRYKNLN